MEQKRQKGSIASQTSELENLIVIKNEEIEKLKKIKENLLSEQSKAKNNYDYEISQTQSRVKLSKEKADLSEISLKSLKYDLNKKKTKLKK